MNKQLARPSLTENLVHFISICIVIFKDFLASLPGLTSKPKHKKKKKKHKEVSHQLDLNETSSLEPVLHEEEKPIISTEKPDLEQITIESIDESWSSVQSKRQKRKNRVEQRSTCSEIKVESKSEQSVNEPSIDIKEIKIEEDLSFYSISTLTSVSELSSVDGLDAISEERQLSIPPNSPGEPSSRFLIPTHIKPPCYKNNYFLRSLINLMSEVFKKSPIKGYLFGSSNYKISESPNDSDVILEKIISKQDKAQVDALIQEFKALGGQVTVHDQRGEEGYRTGNRHVIPMLLMGWKIDFIISEKTILEHSQMMDFTIGALYFDLAQKKMFRVSGMIRTVIDPIISFYEDPSRIFRAIRLMASEGFYLSPASHQAILFLFSHQQNLFACMKPGKLFQQLDLMFDSGHIEAIIAIFYKLGLFYPLFQCVSNLYEQGGYRYIPHLQAYDNQQRYMYVVPYAQCFFVPYQPLPSAEQTHDLLYQQSESMKRMF